MNIELAHIIQSYIDASNAHDVAAILTCFADGATVRDENQTMQGKEAIERWLATTIEKYKFHFSPKTARTDAAQTVVTVEVSGTFPGSPITLDYHFAIEKAKIASLTIDS